MALYEALREIKFQKNKEKGFAATELGEYYELCVFFWGGATAVVQ